MVKKRIYYAHINNMGDALNALLMDKVFHVEQINPVHIYDYDIMGIGSCLDTLFYGGDFPVEKRRFLIQEILLGKLVNRKAYVWGTGFLKEYDFTNAKCKRDKVEFVALRGELTRQAVSKITGKAIDVPLGDGGLLAALLTNEMELKKNGKIGIVPHYREKNCPQLQALLRMVDNAILIDVQDEPMDVIKQIASCEYIISSSLHGLIVADSFGINNTRIKLTDAPLGTGFKFDDYYSAFGMKKKAIVINENNVPSLTYLMSVPQIEHKMVVQKQNQLVNAMKMILIQK